QSGILALGQQAGLQILAPQQDLAGVRINAVEGDHDAREAVRIALHGTGLRIVSDDGRTLLLRRQQADAPSSIVVDDVVVTGVARATDKFRTS
ncbi:STN domain-containing protein, partial [Enterococcus faecium]|uniref:STN domain-containing protein n=1 Tax=Enterococcus faecium TaxID=1352 RepID=UPI0034E94018